MDGRRISIEFNVVLLQDDGRVLGAGAIIQDVTARRERDKGSSRTLAEREGKLKQV